MSIQELCDTRKEIARRALHIPIMSDQVTEPSFDITTGWYFWVSLDEAIALDQLLERCPLANKPLQSILHRLRGSAKAQGFRLQATENASASARSPRSPSSDDESLSCCSIDGSIAAEETEEESLETAQSSGESTRPCFREYRIQRTTGFHRYYT